MSEQGRCDPTSFKDQMVARYRERLSIGIAMGAGAYTAAHQTHAKLEEVKTPEEQNMRPDIVVNASHGNESPVPTAKKSRTYLDEYFTDFAKPTMAELISKFENRSASFSQMKRNKRRTRKDIRTTRSAWGSSCSEIKRKVHHKPPKFCSSSNSIISNKSILSKPVIVNITSPTTRVRFYGNKTMNENLGESNGQISPFGDKNTEDKKHTDSEVEEGMNVTNSHTAQESENFGTEDNQCIARSNVDMTEYSKDIANNFDSEYDSRESKLNSSGIINEKSKLRSRRNYPLMPPPLRISLRNSATRKKASTSGKYVVHKKDWTNKPPAMKNATGADIFILTGNDGKVSKYTGDKYKMVNVMTYVNPKVDDECNTSKPGTNVDKYKSASDVKSSSQIKLHYRNLLRESPTNIGVNTMEERKMTAVERYLKFLKSSNISQPLSLSAHSKKELRKTSSSATPHSLWVEGKGNDLLPQNSLHNLRKPIKSTQGERSTANQKNVVRNTPLSDTGVEIVSHKPMPKSKFASLRVKELGPDSSTNDLFHNLLLSSSNSVTSSICDETSFRFSQRVKQRQEHVFSRYSVPQDATKSIDTGRRESNKETNSPQILSTPHSIENHGLILKGNSQSKPPHTTILIRSPVRKAIDEGSFKPSILSASSPKHTSSVTSFRLDTTNRHFKHQLVSKERRGRMQTGVYANRWSCNGILTEDELADNDLVPVHLRDRNNPKVLQHIFGLISGSEDSYNDFIQSPTNPKTFENVARASNEELAAEKPALIDTLQTQYIAKKTKTDANSCFVFKDHVKKLNNDCKGKRGRRMLPRRITQGHNIVPGSDALGNNLKAPVDPSTRGDKRLSLLPGHSVTTRSKKNPSRHFTSEDPPSSIHKKQKKLAGDKNPQKTPSLPKPGDETLEQEVHVHVSDPPPEEDIVDELSGLENKINLTPPSSPEKKKRKVENSQNLMILNKDKGDADDETIEPSGGRSAIEKEDRIVKTEEIGKPEEKFDNLRKSANKEQIEFGDIQEKSEKSVRICSEVVQEVNRTWRLNSPDNISVRSLKVQDSQRIDGYISPGLMQLRRVSRVACYTAIKSRFKSHIPLPVRPFLASRNKLEKLIQYRRWREAMLDCLHPSKLPLTESFRLSLDSAVMEEWALHCWHPCHQAIVNSQNIWWNPSYQKEPEENLIETQLGDGRLFSKEGLLDITARLPYIKVGPIRFVHATYFLMAAVCVTIGHIGVGLYHCQWDEYEYYCHDDDIDCLVNLVSHIR